MLVRLLTLARLRITSLETAEVRITPSAAPPEVIVRIRDFWSLADCAALAALAPQFYELVEPALIAGAAALVLPVPAPELQVEHREEPEPEP